MLTRRQKILLTHIIAASTKYIWLEVNSYNKAYRDDLHALWSDKIIEWNEAGTHIKLTAKGLEK